MADYAIVIMSNADTPEGRGKMAHAMKLARGLNEAGESVEVHFAGIGVQWLTAFAEQSHPFTTNYNESFEAIRPLIKSTCDFCTRVRFKAQAGADALGIELVGGERKHNLLVDVATSGAKVITF